MKKFLFLLTGLMFMLASCGGGEDEILDSPDNPNTPNNPTPAPKPNDPNTVVLTTAGTLKDSLEENYLDYRTLKVVGPINGDDIYWLREMMGGGEDESVKGKLTNLDLSEAKIVSGGNWYIDEEDAGKQYSSNNVVGQYMFANCDILSSIVLPNSVTSIDKGAFSDCTSLISITIPDGVSSIEYNAFYRCKHLASVTIGKGVTSIKPHAFGSCDALTSIYISDLSQWCCIDFEDYYANPLITGAKLYVNNKELSELVIPNDITEIKPYTFCGGNITSVIIPDNVVSIGDYAFYYCNMTSVTFGKGLTTTGYRAFWGCAALRSIAIPDNITSIEEGAFLGCAQLESVTLGKGLTSIGESAFSSCNALTSIVIPDNIISIGGNAFEYCVSLESVTLGKGLTSIEGYVFLGCEALTSIAIPDNITSIEYEAFYACTKLESVTIGKGITSIGENAFDHCDALTSVYISDLSQWCCIDFVGPYANPLNSGAILNLDNKELVELVIPNDVWNIKDWAFFGSGITKVILPKDAPNIGQCAFYECKNLSEYCSYSTSPPYAYNSFDNTNKTKVLYVPKGCSGTYQSSQYWGPYFNNIIEMKE